MNIALAANGIEMSGKSKIQFQSEINRKDINVGPVW